jgi:hypothetical protein
MESSGDAQSQAESQQPQQTPEQQPSQQWPAPNPGQALQANPAGGRPYPGAAPGPAVPGPAKRGVRPWVWWLVGGCAAFIVLVAVGITVLVLVLGAGGAKPVAQNYLGDLQKGDASAANTLSRTPSTGDNALLTDAVLSKATRITNPQVTGLQQSSDTAVATVSYRLGGRTYSDQIELQKDSKGWYVVHGLAYALPTLSSDDTGAGYSLEGAKSGISTATAALVAYPGVYTLSASSELFSLQGARTLTVARDAADQISDVTVVPSKTYIAQVQDQVDAHLKACAAQTDYDTITDCGIDLSFPDNVDTDGSTVAVTISQYPVVELQTGGDLQFAVTGGSFSATITGPTYDGGSGSEQLTADDSYLSFTAQVQAGKVVVDFN